MRTIQKTAKCEKQLPGGILGSENISQNFNRITSILKNTFEKTYLVTRKHEMTKNSVVSLHFIGYSINSNSSAFWVPIFQLNTKHKAFAYLMYPCCKLLGFKGSARQKISPVDGNSLK